MGEITPENEGNVASELFGFLPLLKGHFGIDASKMDGETHTHTHTGKATKGKVQDIGEVNKVMPLPLPSSDRVRG